MNARTFTVVAAAMLATAGGAAYAQTKPAPDGAITRADWQARAAQMFDRLDVNKDGKIDSADRAARAQQRFAQLDTDKDGKLSPAELAAAHGRRGPGGAERPQLDPGRGDGPMHDGEMGRGKMGGHRMDKKGKGGMTMLKQADANNDGVIAQAEFIAASDRRFAAMDSNNDGQVTAAERQAAREKMRAEWRARAAVTPAPAN